MAQHSSLIAESRQRSGSSAINRMRKEGLVPAIIYGRNFENANLKINRKAITDLLHGSASDNVLVDLQIEGAAGTQLALIEAVQHDYLKGDIVHVDFRAVKEDDQINAQVPIVLVGTCIGVKNGGVLDQQLKALNVICASKDLPESLSLNVENIDVGDAAHISELEVPEGVTVSLDDGVVVAMVQESRVAQSEEDEAAAAAAEGAEGEAEGSEEAAAGEES